MTDSRFDQISTDAQLNEALSCISELMDLDPEDGSPDAELLMTLVSRVEQFESIRYPEFR